MVNVCVVGAGVVGLVTADVLLREMPAARVTVVAERLSPHTTSDVAAGLFTPLSTIFAPTEETAKQWTQDSYNYYNNIKQAGDGPAAGVSQISGYILSSQYDIKNSLFEGVLPKYRPATVEELNLFPGDWKYGSFCTTLIVEGYKLLPWLLDRFQKRGGKLKKQKISSLEELCGPYDVIVNCSGYGAKFLCNDNKVIPIRGQVFKVKAPWINTFISADYDTYVIPGVELVTLGGTRQFGSYKLTVDKHDSSSIWERCTALLPNLRRAEVAYEAVALRPYRSPIRLEKEVVKFGSKTLNVVHQYGHGGYGMTTAPGTAVHAVKLVKDFVSGKRDSIPAKL